MKRAPSYLYAVWIPATWTSGGFWDYAESRDKCFDCLRTYVDAGKSIPQNPVIRRYTLVPK